MKPYTLESLPLEKAEDSTVKSLGMHTDSIIIGRQMFIHEKYICLNFLDNFDIYIISSGIKVHTLNSTSPTLYSYDLKYIYNKFDK